MIYVEGTQNEDWLALASRSLYTCKMDRELVKHGMNTEDNVRYCLKED